MENAPKSNKIRTLFKYDTIHCADSVEWCPFERNYFVCANYQIEENQQRFGRILLFSIDNIKGLNLHQTIETAAVLDQKWCPFLINDTPLLGVVNALKTLEIYSFTNEELKLKCKIEVPDDSESETLVLSLDWCAQANKPSIVCSDSKGKVHIFHLTNNDLVLEKSWKNHSYEAWIAAFDYCDENVFFSGGDDCLFFKYDRRVENAICNKQHEAGVTAMHSNKKRQHLLATGSYDENVRLWDVRNLKNPTKSIKMPGTLWRLKWDPFVHDFLLSACMLGGVHVIKAKDNNLEIVESYYEHKNISYGADWSFLTEDEISPHFEGSGNVIIATCSFYDHLLCVSKLQLEF